MRAAATIMPASRHRAARGLRRRCAMPGVARGHATIYTNVGVGAYGRYLNRHDSSVNYLSARVSSSFTLDDHDGYIYIILGRRHSVYSALCTSRPPPRAPAATWTGTPRTAIASNPAERERKSGFQAADGGHHAGARRRRTAASSGRPAARHEATKPPPRAHLANELGSLQRAPCFSSSLPRRLSADGGATRPFRRPRHTPKRASARLGSCRRWHCTGRWHCSPLALH